MYIFGSRQRWENGEIDFVTYYGTITLDSYEFQ